MYVKYYLSRVKGQQALVDHTVKQCTFAMYDCRQPEDVSCLESVHMVTKILSQVFIRCCHLHLPSLSSVVPQSFGALELNGPLYTTSYIMFTWRAFSFQYFHASNFTSNSSMDSALITRSSFYKSNYGHSVLNFAIRASYIATKSSGVRTEPRWTSTPKNFSLRQLPTIVLLFMSLIMPCISCTGYLLI